MYCLIGLGLGWFLHFFSSCRPPRSVLGHGLGNRAAKLRHGTVGFSRSFIFRLGDAPFSPEPGGAARVIWLPILWQKTV